MPYNTIIHAKYVMLLATSASSLAGTAVSAVGITEQLSQPHHFMHLNLPLWMFFLGVFLLSFVGSVASLFTDTMELSNGKKISNLIMGFMTGVLGAFVLLPAITDDPSVDIMLVTALIMAFSGTVLLHIFGTFLRSDTTKSGVTQAIVEFASVIKDRIILAIKALFGNGE